MKNILVTGAYGGMGRAAVALLTQKGYRVFALDKKTDAPTENVIPIEADITEEGSVAAALDAVRAHTSCLDAILHFAGIYMLDSLVEISEEDLHRIMNVNFFGAFFVNKAFLPLLHKGARILITTSELAPLDPLPFTGVYAVTKSALDKYAYSLCMELQLVGISVSVLRAGAVDTGMLKDSTDALDRFCESTSLYSCNAARFKKIVERVEARRIPPEKLARRALSVLERKNPAFAYSINRNPLLLLLNLLPKRLQLRAIRLVLR